MVCRSTGWYQGRFQLYTFHKMSVPRLQLCQDRCTADTGHLMCSRCRFGMCCILPDHHSQLNQRTLYQLNRVKGLHKLSYQLLRLVVEYTLYTHQMLKTNHRCKQRSVLRQNVDQYLLDRVSMSCAQC